jgi:hypothetical protein
MITRLMGGEEESVLDVRLQWMMDSGFWLRFGPPPSVKVTKIKIQQHHHPTQRQKSIETTISTEADRREAMRHPNFPFKGYFLNLCTGCFDMNCHKQ